MYCASGFGSRLSLRVAGGHLPAGSEKACAVLIARHIPSSIGDAVLLGLAYLLACSLACLPFFRFLFKGVEGGRRRAPTRTRAKTVGLKRNSGTGEPCGFGHIRSVERVLRRIACPLLAQSRRTSRLGVTGRESLRPTEHRRRLGDMLGSRTRRADLVGNACCDRRRTWTCEPTDALGSVRRPSCRSPVVNAPRAIRGEVCTARALGESEHAALELVVGRHLGSPRAAAKLVEV